MNPQVQTQQVDQHMTVKTLKVGADKQTFRINQDGVFAGGDRFDKATWRLDYKGKVTHGETGQIVIDPITETITIGTAPSNIVIDGINNKQTWGATLTADANTQTFTAGAAGEVEMDGALGQIRTNNILDKTYGLYGVFAAQIVSTNFTTNEDIIITPNNGGLMNAKAMIVTPAPDSFLVDLPNFNPSFSVNWTIYKVGSDYVLRHNGSVIGGVYINFEKILYTVFFNSNEALKGY
jgi:hypothetical protein